MSIDSRLSNSLNVWDSTSVSLLKEIEKKDNSLRDFRSELERERKELKSRTMILTWTRF